MGVLRLLHGMGTAGIVTAAVIQPAIAVTAVITDVQVQTLLLSPKPSPKI